MTSPSTLKQEAKRAGVTPDEYTARIERGLLFCDRCPVPDNWHPEAAFPKDERRHTGRATSCTRSIRAAVRGTLPLPVRRPLP